MSYNEDEQMKEFLSNATDQILAGEINLESLAQQYQLSKQETAEIAFMVNQLEMVYANPITPGKAFKQDLRTELLGKPQRSMFVRFRNLPPRIQIAAAVAIFAAMALLGRRRLTGDFGKLMEQIRDIPVQTDGQEVKVSAP